MNSLTSHDILALARETLHKEADALTHMAAELDEQFVGAVDSILACAGKVILTGMG